MIDTFLFCDCGFVSHGRTKCGDIRTEWPLLRAISFKFLKTTGSVRGFGLKRVFWLFLEFYKTRYGNAEGRSDKPLTIATRPRSPSFLRSAFTIAMLRPVDSLIALTSKLSPIPSSMPT